MLHRVWFALACISVWLFSGSVAFQASAQTPQPSAGVDLPKINRYFSLEMYSEAATALESAIKADEFNGELRFLYGVALQDLQRYEEAIHNFQLATKLGRDNWEVLDHLVQCYLGKYAQSSENPDRILAYNTASQLVQLSPPAQQEASANQRLREAKRRALEMMERLDSPVGVWRMIVLGESPSTREVELRESKNGNFFWTGAGSPNPGEKCLLCLPIELRKSSPSDLTGSGTYGIGGCVMESDFTLHWQEVGTKLIEKRSSTRYKGPGPEGDRPTSLAQLKVIDEACKIIMRQSPLITGPPPRVVTLTFERVR